jgi:hypothetical protein
MDATMTDVAGTCRNAAEADVFDLTGMEEICRPSSYAPGERHDHRMWQPFHMIAAGLAIVNLRCRAG